MHQLPQLEYDYDALSPSISADIMHLHHARHHQTYVDKLNQAVKGTDAENTSLTEMITALDSVPDDIRTAVRNNGGGHWNHTKFWRWMSPNGGGQPNGQMLRAIEGKYGSYQGFVDEFTSEALGIFGSGWCWLMPDMSIITTPNQDSPMMNGADEPLLGLDVWEHAYYLDYKNVRDDYVKAWWDVVDWQYVSQDYTN